MGLMDLFPANTGSAGPPPSTPPPAGGTTGLTMGYYDGNTVTALWNYAQHFAMSDNSYGTTFGPSTPGLMNLVAGQTNGVAQHINGTGDETDGGSGTLTVVGDPDPLNDVCANPTRNQVQMSGKNIGDMLTDAGVTWGSFMGGFDLTIKNANGTTNCSRSSTGLAGTTKDYIPHHAFFQYHSLTANPKHTRPSSISEIGHDGPANHNYDINDFWAAVKAGNLPAVSFIKAPAYQDGHAGYSDPLDEQTFIVNLINFLEKTPEWASTAVIIMYDDSDGWYDPDGADRQPVDQPGGRSHGTRYMWRRHDGVAWPECNGQRARARPVRIWSATPLPDCFVLGKEELRRPHGDRSEFSHPLYRRQLVGQPTSPRWLVRCVSRSD